MTTSGAGATITSSVDRAAAETLLARPPDEGPGYAFRQAETPSFPFLGEQIVLDVESRFAGGRLAVDAARLRRELADPEVAEVRMEWRGSPEAKHTFTLLAGEDAEPD